MEEEKKERRKCSFLNSVLLRIENLESHSVHSVPYQRVCVCACPIKRSVERVKAIES